MAINIENTGAQTLLQSSVPGQLARQSGQDGFVSGRTMPLSSPESLSPSTLSSKSADAINMLIDHLDLSPEAMAALTAENEAVTTLEKGRGALAQQALDSLGKQLQQVKDALGNLETLLGAATGETRDIAIKAFAEQADTLEKIGRQLGFIDRSAVNVAMPAEDQVITAEQTVHSSKSAAMPQHDIANIYKDPIGALQAKYLPPYKEAGLQIKQLLREFESRFTDEEQFPPSIFNQIKRLVSSALNAEKNSVNTLA